MNDRTNFPLNGSFFFICRYDNSSGRHCYTCLTPTATVLRRNRRHRPHPLMDVDESLQLSSLLCQRVVPCPWCSVVLFCSPYCFGSGARAHLLECTNRHYLHTADVSYQGHLVGLVIKILADLMDNQHCGKSIYGSCRSCAHTPLRKKSLLFSLLRFIFVF